MLSESLESELRAAFLESFMKPDIYEDNYFEVETSCGTEFVPGYTIDRTMNVDVSALLNYLEGTPNDPDETVEYKRGWLARLSAPGYMDCTEWCAFETADEAAKYLLEMYGDE